MKKIICLFLCGFTFSVSNFASNFAHKEVVVKPIIENTKQQLPGRQCCEQSAKDVYGNIITIEACAGWFLSNDERAYERACDKALAALVAIVGYANVFSN